MNNNGDEVMPDPAERAALRIEDHYFHTRSREGRDEIATIIREAYAPYSKRMMAFMAKAERLKLNYEDWAAMATRKNEALALAAEASEDYVKKYGGFGSDLHPIHAALDAAKEAG